MLDSEAFHSPLCVFPFFLDVCAGSSSTLEGQRSGAMLTHKFWEHKALTSGVVFAKFGSNDRITPMLPLTPCSDSLCYWQ